MIKITLRSGFYYRGELLEETSEKIIIKDYKGNIVEIAKDQITVRETVDG